MDIIGGGHQSAASEAGVAAAAAAAASSTASVPTAHSFFTLQFIKSSAVNATSYLNPGPKDLLLAFPRLARRAGKFAFFTLPEHVDSILGNRYNMRIIPEATGGGGGTFAAVTNAAAYLHAREAGGAVAGAATAAGGEVPEPAAGISGGLGFNNVRGFGGILSYLTSKWALSCFTMAIILNRTQVYATARRHIRLGWSVRLALRIIPITLFLYQAIRLSQAIRCQTSPDFSLYRYNDPHKRLEHDYAGGGGALHSLSSSLLFWQDDHESCMAARMTPTSFSSPEGRRGLKGSSTLIWPLYQTLCLSQFVETLSCAVQGRVVMTETGMTIFEHSLAFAEAEAMVGNQLGWGPFTSPTLAVDGSRDTYTGQAATAATAITKAAVLSRLNTPPEVLLIGLISSLSHVTSQVLGVFNMQGRFRLVNTGFWALCFMLVFSWSLISFAPGPSGDIGILRFPTVCIVGFIPHMLILMGILVCAGIYVLALFLLATAPPGPERPQSFKERLLMAQQNLQANIQLSTIRINMHEDFYTSLLKVGFTALTAASEAVFLNEGHPVGVRPWTWLEEERMQELESARNAELGSGFAMPQELASMDGSSVATGVGLVEETSEGTVTKHHRKQWKSGYARERTTAKLTKDKSGKARMRGDGVGAAERNGRWMMAWELFQGIFWLVSGALAIVAIKLLESVGIHRKPEWLKQLARQEKVTAKAMGSGQEDEGQKTLEFWLLSDEGILSLPEDENVDVEVEMRKRLRDNPSRASQTATEQEEELDNNLYGWWKQGGWFGELDASGDFQPSTAVQEDDTTSVISCSSTTNDDGEVHNIDDGWSTSSSSSGRRTPTQSDPHPVPSTPSIKHLTLDLPHLSRLLDPLTPAEKQEARLLSHHLSDHSPTPLTRSRYRTAFECKRARVLTSSRHTPKLTGTDESAILESLLLARRQPPSPSAVGDSSSAWASGATGLGASGPQCVVCQSAPRTILVWPCRCLSLCEDCRVSLAMNNFGNCVCCRRDVVGFSRLFVP